MFRYDSPFMRFCSSISDLVFLNFLTVVCSIPIFTIGAASTALHDAIYRIKLGEGHIYGAFFKAFASNFKQATLLWLMFLPGLVLLAASLVFFLLSSFANTLLLGISCLLLTVWLMAMSWAFPLQSRFENSVMDTFRNSFSYALAHAPRSIVMAVLNGIPLVCLAMPSLYPLTGMPIVCFYFSLAIYVIWGLVKKPLNLFSEEEE